MECRARLLHTGRTSLHVSVHVRSGDPKIDQLGLTTHCLIVFVALDESRQPKPVPRWEPQSDEDLALEKARHHPGARRTPGQRLAMDMRDTLR